jgi:hypothetical protein
MAPVAATAASTKKSTIKKLPRGMELNTAGMVMNSSDGPRQVGSRRRTPPERWRCRPA